jgi:hypothetical protein
MPRSGTTRLWIIQKLCVATTVRGRSTTRLIQTGNEVVVTYEKERPDGGTREH